MSANLKSSNIKKLYFSAIFIRIYRITKEKIKKKCHSIKPVGTELQWARKIDQNTRKNSKKRYGTSISSIEGTIPGLH